MRNRISRSHVAAHQSEVEELEIAKSAVDQAGRTGCGAGAEVGLLHEGDLEPTKGGVARDARPDDPAADDEEIDGAVAERPHRLVSRSEEHTSELQSPCNLVCRLLL